MVFIAGTSEDSSFQLDQSAYNGESIKSSPAQIKLYSPRNAATISGLIWVMKSICCNFSAATCRNIRDTFDAMFPEAIPKDFSLSPKKNELSDYRCSWTIFLSNDGRGLFLLFVLMKQRMLKIKNFK